MGAVGTWSCKWHRVVLAWLVLCVVMSFVLCVCMCACTSLPSVLRQWSGVAHSWMGIASRAKQNKHKPPWVTNTTHNGCKKGKGDHKLAPADCSAATTAAWPPCWATCKAVKDIVCQQEALTNADTSQLCNPKSGAAHLQARTHLLPVILGKAVLTKVPQTGHTVPGAVT
jgi:hypothetical protein